MGLIPYENEKYQDWSDAGVRDKMRDALSKVGGVLRRSYPLVIGGKRVKTDGEIASLDPSDPSRVVGLAGRATEREADMALETATRAFAVRGAGRCPRRGPG